MAARVALLGAIRMAAKSERGLSARLQVQLSKTRGKPEAPWAGAISLAWEEAKQPRCVGRLEGRRALHPRQEPSPGLPERRSKMEVAGRPGQPAWKAYACGCLPWQHQVREEHPCTLFS